MKREIKLARQRAAREISDHACQGKVAAGLAAEGYVGGYRDALDDVLLLLNGVQPNRRHYWEPRSYDQGKAKP